MPAPTCPPPAPTTSYPTPPSDPQPAKRQRTTRSSAAAAAAPAAAPTKELVDQTPLAHLAADFIQSLFQCPSSEGKSLASFIRYALYRTQLAPSVTYAALVLLHRLKSRYPEARGTSGHRLYLAASMIASKVICDDTFANSSWQIVSKGMFTLKEVNQMERELFSHLGYRVIVEQHEIDAVEHFLNPSRYASQPVRKPQRQPAPIPYPSPPVSPCNSASGSPTPGDGSLVSYFPAVPPREAVPIVASRCATSARVC